MTNEEASAHREGDARWDRLLSNLKTGVAEPRWPPIPTADGAGLLALQFQLEKTQFMSGELLGERQRGQAARLLRYASQAVPFYRERIPPAVLDALPDPDAWYSVPILSRPEVQRAGPALVTRRPLPGHQQLEKIQTSGSTGTPVTAYTTQVTRFFWYAFTLRDHLWHRRDFSGRLLTIRPEGDLEPGAMRRFDNWGRATAALVHTGPCVLLSPRTDLERQLEVLLAEDPDYLLSMPSNLRALIRLYGAGRRRLTRLREVRSYGEVAGDGLRELCREVLGVPLVDMYSAQEVGYIALQCPDHPHYHVQSEGLLVEILDDRGRPCGPGETGQVVVTTLQNYGSPLIRYALGDYAEAGDPCPCGRGLPVIRRVQGRQRNMVRLPDGRCHWPSFPVRGFSPIGGIRQFQLAQTAPDLIEARLVVDRPLDASQAQAFRDLVRERLDYPFRVEIRYRDAIVRSASGKFEDFVSEMPAGPGT